MKCKDCRSDVRAFKSVVTDKNIGFRCQNNKCPNSYIITFKDYLPIWAEEDL